MGDERTELSVACCLCGGSEENELLCCNECGCWFCNRVTPTLGSHICYHQRLMEHHRFRFHPASDYYDWMLSCDFCGRSSIKELSLFNLTDDATSIACSACAEFNFCERIESSYRLITEEEEPTFILCETSRCQLKVMSIVNRHERLKAEIDMAHEKAGKRAAIRAAQLAKRKADEAKALKVAEEKPTAAANHDGGAKTAEPVHEDGDAASYEEALGEEGPDEWWEEERYWNRNGLCSTAYSYQDAQPESEGLAAGGREELHNASFCNARELWAQRYREVDVRFSSEVQRDEIITRYGAEFEEVDAALENAEAYKRHFRRVIKTEQKYIHDNTEFFEEDIPVTLKQSFEETTGDDKRKKRNHLTTLTFPVPSSIVQPQDVDSLRIHFNDTEYSIVLSTRFVTWTIDGKVSVGKCTFLNERKLQDLNNGFFKCDILFLGNDVSFERQLNAIDMFAKPQTTDIHEDIKSIMLSAGNPDYLKSNDSEVIVDIDDVPSVFSAHQSAAFQKSLRRKVALIQGPPGTGKTFFICHMIEKIVKHSHSKVLLSAPSNQAVLNGCEIMVKMGMKVLRLESRKRFVREFETKECVVSQAVKDHSLYHRYVKDTMMISNPNQVSGQYCKMFDSTSDAPTTERLSQKKKDLDSVMQFFNKLFEEADVIISTANNVGSSILGFHRFPIVVIDEAGQLTEPDALIPLTRGCKMAILVGDHYQLPPLVQSSLAESMGLGISLFQRLSSVIKPILLNIQYRMHPEIGSLISKLFYDGRVENGVSVESRTMVGLQNFLPNRSVPIVFVDHQGKNEKKIGFSYQNEAEASIISTIIDDLVSVGIYPGDIGVISPYEAQKLCILGTIGHRVEVNNVDAYQGREKDIIILSCVRSNLKEIIGFLRSKNRLNVALSRSRFGLFIVGDSSCLKTDIWNSLFFYLSQMKTIVSKWGDTYPVTMDRFVTKKAVAYKRFDAQSVYKTVMEPGTTLEDLCAMNLTKATAKDEELVCFFIRDKMNNFNVEQDMDHLIQLYPTLIRMQLVKRLSNKNLLVFYLACVQSGIMECMDLLLRLSNSVLDGLDQEVLSSIRIVLYRKGMFKQMELLDKAFRLNSLETDMKLFEELPSDYERIVFMDQCKERLEFIKSLPAKHRVLQIVLLNRYKRSVTDAADNSGSSFVPDAKLNECVQKVIVKDSATLAVFKKYVEGLKPKSMLFALDTLSEGNLKRESTCLLVISSKNRVFFIDFTKMMPLQKNVLKVLKDLLNDQFVACLDNNRVASDIKCLLGSANIMKNVYDMAIHFGYIKLKSRTIQELCEETLQCHLPALDATTSVITVDDLSEEKLNRVALHCHMLLHVIAKEASLYQKKMKFDLVPFAIDHECISSTISKDEELVLQRSREEAPPGHSISNKNVFVLLDAVAPLFVSVAGVSDMLKRKILALRFGVKDSQISKTIVYCDSSPLCVPLSSPVRGSTKMGTVLFVTHDEVLNEETVSRAAAVEAPRAEEFPPIDVGTTRVFISEEFPPIDVGTTRVFISESLCQTESFVLQIEPMYFTLVQPYEIILGLHAAILSVR